MTVLENNLNEYHECIPTVYHDNLDKLCIQEDRLVLDLFHLWKLVMISLFDTSRDLKTRYGSQISISFLELSSPFWVIKTSKLKSTKIHMKLPVEEPKIHVVWDMTLQNLLLTEGKKSAHAKMHFFFYFDLPHFCTVISIICSTTVEENEKKQEIRNLVLGISWPILSLRVGSKFRVEICDTKGQILLRVVCLCEVVDFYGKWHRVSNDVFLTLCHWSIMLRSLTITSQKKCFWRQRRSWVYDIKRRLFSFVKYWFFSYGSDQKHGKRDLRLFTQISSPSLTSSPPSWTPKRYCDHARYLKSTDVQHDFLEIYRLMSATTRTCFFLQSWINRRERHIWQFDRWDTNNTRNKTHRSVSLSRDRPILHDVMSLFERKLHSQRFVDVFDTSSVSAIFWTSKSRVVMRSMTERSSVDRVMSWDLELTWDFERNTIWIYHQDDCIRQYPM